MATSVQNTLDHSLSLGWPTIFKPLILDPFLFAHAADGTLVHFAGKIHGRETEGQIVVQGDTYIYSGNYADEYDLTGLEGKLTRPPAGKKIIYQEPGHHQGSGFSSKRTFKNSSADGVWVHHRLWKSKTSQVNPSHIDQTFINQGIVGDLQFELPFLIYHLANSSPKWKGTYGHIVNGTIGLKDRATGKTVRRFEVNLEAELKELEEEVLLGYLTLDMTGAIVDKDAEKGDRREGLLAFTASLGSLARMPGNTEETPRIYPAKVVWKGRYPSIIEGKLDGKVIEEKLEFIRSPQPLAGVSHLDQPKPGEQETDSQLPELKSSPTPPPPTHSTRKPWENS